MLFERPPSPQRPEAPGGAARSRSLIRYGMPYSSEPDATPRAADRQKNAVRSLSCGVDDVPAGGARERPTGPSRGRSAGTVEALSWSHALDGRCGVDPGGESRVRAVRFMGRGTTSCRSAKCPRAAMSCGGGLAGRIPQVRATSLCPSGKSKRRSVRGPRPPSRPNGVPSTQTERRGEARPRRPMLVRLNGLQPSPI